MYSCYFSGNRALADTRWMSRKVCFAKQGGLRIPLDKLVAPLPNPGSLTISVSAAHTYKRPMFVAINLCTDTHLLTRFPNIWSKKLTPSIKSSYMCLSFDFFSTCLLKTYILSQLSFYNHYFSSTFSFKSTLSFPESHKR